MRKHFSILLLLAMGVILLFANLGNQFLWQDEAETATLAKNTLEYGFPRAFDGKNLINPVIRTGYGEDYGWRYHPWGQFYITALSLKLFGITTFGARFLFALLGVANILLLYLLAYRLTGNKFVAFCSSFLMTFSVSYLLLMRQCRYYAPAVFLVLCVLIFYLKFKETGSWKNILAMATAFISLGYTVHGMFVPVFAAIGLHYLLFSFKKETFPKMCLAGVGIVLFIVPWFLYSNSLTHAAAVSLGRMGDNLEFQVRMINKFIFPIVFFGIVYLIRVIWKRKFAVNITSKEKEALTLIGMVVLCSICAFCFAEERNFRYLVFLMPLFAIIEGIILLRLVKLKSILLVLFLVISVMTGIFNMGTPNFYFPKYLYEITHDYNGPIEGIVKFLNKNAEAGDTVKIIYGDLPLMFYTDLIVDNSNVYDDAHMPRFIVFRRGWHETLDNDYYTKIKKTHKKHVLDYPDITWENRPGDMGYHKFATDKEAPGVIVFERE